MKHKLIYDPVFRSETLFYLCKDGNKALKHAKKKYNVTLDKDSFDGYKGMCVELTSKTTNITAWMVWVKYDKDWKTMVHESAHLTFNVLDARGVGYNSKNDETWCYLHEYFVTEFWHIMCKGSK